MPISLFDVTGPVMIGPSSSHTAGAAKLGRIASLIAEGSFHKVEFLLHGSFAKTYRGHGTDLALVAGILGMSESDENLPRSFELAKEAGISYSFGTVELSGVGENTALIRFYLDNGRVREIVGSSLGGGRICIVRVDGFETELYCECPTLMVIHQDKPGMLSRITAEMALSRLNIAVLRCTRREKGNLACTVIESDDEIPHRVQDILEKISGIKAVSIISQGGANRA